MRAGPGGWAEGCGGLGALPPPATPDPAALAERGLPPHPVRCSGPRDPGGVGLRGPPPPDPRGPGASEPPAGLGAANLERPTCPAPARCPNPPGATEARSTGAPQPRPFALPRRPPCPHAARQAPDLPERADEPQAGTQTDTHTRTHPRHGRQLACASSSARAIAPGRGRGQTKGPADGCRERQRQKSMKLPRQTPRRREGDTDTHTHTHLSVVFGNTSVRSCWVEPNFYRTHGVRPIRLLCPWHFPGENTGVGCHYLLQGIFPTQGSNPSLLRADALPSEPAHCEFPRQNTKKRARVLLSGKMIEETEGVLCWYLGIFL